MKFPDISTYTGITIIAGKEHMITRVTCKKCRSVLSETHFGCCGHAESGWGGGKCKCKSKRGKDGGNKET